MNPVSQPTPSKKFCLIIPAYNEEKNLPLLLERTLRAATEAGYNEKTFSLILVENGSTDNSLEVIRKELEKSPQQNLVQVLPIKQNRGYGHGLLSGLQAADGEILGWTHADLQCDPKNAFLAYEEYLQQNTPKILIKGTRSGRLLRDRLVSGVFTFLASGILGLKTGEINAQPKVFPKILLEQLINPPLGFNFDLYVLYCAQKAGYLTVSIPVLFPPRIHGVSHWAAHFTGRYKTIWAMILYMIKLRRTEGPL